MPQAEQMLEPSTLNVPASHLEQVVDPAALNFPAPQSEHRNLFPAFPLKVPGGHFLHLFAVVSMYVVAVHSENKYTNRFLHNY